MSLAPAFASSPPYPAPCGLQGTRGRGLTYQHRVGKVLQPLAKDLGWAFYAEEWIYHGAWLQPDFILISPSNAALILDAKLTFTESAWPQLARYAAALSAWGYGTTCIQVCRNLTPSAPPAVADFVDLDDQSVWHLFL